MKNFHALSILLLCATAPAIIHSMDNNLQDAATPPPAPTNVIASALNQADNLGRTPLHALTYTSQIADEGQRIELVKKLVARGASINTQDKDGLTPLHFSITHKRPAVFISALYTLGADTRLGNLEQKTPLLIACENGCIEQLEALLSLIPELQPQAAILTPIAPIITAETIINN